MAFGLERHNGQRRPFAQRRQDHFLVLELGLRVVRALDVRAQEAGERDRLAGGRELGVPSVARRRPEANLDALPARVCHLRRDRALPDQVVQTELVAAQLVAHVVRRSEHVAGRTDRFVRFLRVLHAARVAAGLLGDRVRAVHLDRLRARGGDGRVRQRHRVGPHVRDVAVLVQRLRNSHRAVRAESKLARGLLLQGRRHEGSSRRATPRLLLDAAHAEVGAVERRRQAARGLLVQTRDVGRLQRAALVEVLAGREARAVERHELSGEPAVAGFERAFDIPVGSRAEPDARALSLDQDPRRHGLHAPRREARHDLLPEDRGDLVPVQPIEDPAGLLRVDEAAVELARVLDRGLDRRPSDLVEHHPLHGDPRVQHLREVPCDRFPLAVFVRREVKLAGVLQQRLELRNLLALVGTDDVDRLEPVVDVDAHPGPGFGLECGRNLARVSREVADVADRGLDHEISPEYPGDRFRFGGGLDDDEGLRHGRKDGQPRGAMSSSRSARTCGARAISAGRRRC